MTNATSTSRENMTRSFARSVAKASDQAPMVITRLSGWIDVADGKSPLSSWIVPTRSHRSK